MNASSLLDGKTTPTQLPDICVTREGLMEVFSRAAENRILRVTAPAGYGKTVSTRLWLKACKRKDIWVRLDTYDNTAPVFYKLLCGAIAAAQPYNGNMKRVLDDPLFTSAPVDFAVRMLSEFIRDDASYALVLDDAHCINSEEVLGTLPFVLNRLPGSFVVAVLSRGPALDLETEGYSVIEAPQLLFNTAEISELFAACRRYLSEEEAENVRDLTDGWAMGVKTLAKSQCPLTLQGCANALNEYINKHIWGKWDNQQRAFLLKTSVADELTPDLCRALTGREDSAEMLESLCHMNAFVTRTEAGVYHCHRLLNAFLREKLDTGDMLAAELFHAAANYYFDNRDYAQALDFALRTRDESTITSILEECCDHKGASPEQLMSILAANDTTKLPDVQPDTYPMLEVLLTWAACVRGDAEAYESAIAALQRHFPEKFEHNPQLCYHAAIVMSQNHEECFADQTRLSAYINPAFIGDAPALDGGIPFLHRGVRDFSIFAKDSESGAMDTAFRTMYGKSAEIRQLCVISGLYLERNKPDKALSAALEAQTLIRNAAQDAIHISVASHVAAAYAASWDDARALETLAEAENREIARKDGYLEAQKTHILILQGNRGAARKWLDVYPCDAHQTPALYDIFRHFTTARAYIILGHASKAEQVLNTLYTLAACCHRPLDISETLALRTVLEWATGQKKEARRTAEEMLTVMQKHGLIRAAAGEGGGILPVLKRIAAETKKATYNGALESRFVNEVLLAAYEQSKRRKSIAGNLNNKPLKLSRQQKLMLSLLAQGYKNAQISQITGLKIPTVKTHLYLAYEKLGVTNGMDAVIRAKELGML